MNAIAAMALNRVIGRDGKMPWHLPEDLRWFKQATSGGVVAMGRKTFASLGKPLPGRRNVVFTHGAVPEGTEAGGDPAAFDPAAYAPQPVWIIGGGEIYRQLLPRCERLFLTVLLQEVPGDTYFPPFEESFALEGLEQVGPGFEIRRYRRLPLP